MRALFLLAAVVCAQPVTIQNSTVKASVQLPKPDGYYQGTRFDWSGVVASMEWAGHSIFGKWFDHYDPKIHDAITGPVEEFLTNGAGLGYTEAKPGESFVKIGVGAIRKPDEPRFRQFSTYEIADSGVWETKVHRDNVEFRQTLRDTNGYAYVYTKKLTLEVAGFRIDHELRNTGRKTIDTSVYEHNFYMLDQTPSGPAIRVAFPFEPKPKDTLHFAEIRSNQLVYTSELQSGQTAESFLEGFGSTPMSYDIRVENAKTGFGVRQTSDRPMSRLNFWSIRTTVCPEAYIDMRIPPGQSFKWRIRYEFYALSR